MIPAPPPAPGAHPAPARPRPAPPQPIERTTVVYAVRLFANVLPGLLFAWFWHRFLGKRTRSPALREAIFFSTMAGSSLYAYSEVFASHAHNAFCIGAAIMALATVRERDVLARASGREPAFNLGHTFLAGMFGAGATMFEYPAGVATMIVALWILASNAERRRELLSLSGAALVAAAGVYARFHHAKGAAVLVALAFAAYAATWRGRNVARLLAAAAGAVIPTALTMLFHKRAFGDALKPGYSFLENPQFRGEVAQGFFGATAFSWDAGLRLWFDPSFGLVPCTFVFAVAVAGFASMLSWRPESRAGTTAVRAFFGALTLGSLVKLAMVLKVNHESLAQPAVGAWLVALAMAAMGLFSVTLPPAQRRDRSMGAALVMMCLGLSVLIGTMNNWRGGWQVGPRYLVTLIPALGLASLAGLDALHRSFGDHAITRRAVTMYAAGAAVAAFALTGLASAYFPHVPVEYASPLFEMMLPVMRDGFVPHNAGHLLGLKGGASMGAFTVAALVLCAVVLRGDEKRPVAAVAHALGALAVAVLLLIPAAMVARPESAPVTRYVKTVWEPRPPDAPVAGPALPHETAAQATARARRLNEAGDAPAAMQAWLTAIRATR